MHPSLPFFPDTHITRHAALRVAQRNICAQALELVTMHGVDVPAGGGLMRREVRYDQVTALHAEGFSLDVIEKALRLEAIFASDETLVTCYKRTPRHAGRSTRDRKLTTSSRHRRSLERL